MHLTFLKKLLNLQKPRRLAVDPFYFCRNKTMITMKVSTIRKGITPVTNIEGQQTGLFFDLTNEAVRELMEDFMDTLAVVEGIKEPRIPASEVRAKIKQRLAKEQKLVKL